MSPWPHDDSASLSAFYGPPGTPSNMVLVRPPWQMTYEGRPVRGVQIHRKCADSLARVFNDIAHQVGHDWSRLPAGAVKFSGSYNYRPVRGSSRPSCHAFGAAIDMDAEHNPMNTDGDKGTMSPIVIDAFKREGWYWGGDFRSRQDPMHFQAANEGVQVAELDLPPATDGHDAPVPAPAPTSKSAIEEIPAQIQAIAQTPGIADGVKSLWKSKIAASAATLGTASATTAVTSDPETQTLLFKLAHQPAFWLAILSIVLAGYIAYCRWKDHGRGALQ